MAVQSVQAPRGLTEKEFELFNEIKKNTFIKITEPDPASQTILTLFKEIIQIPTGFKCINLLNKVLGGKPPILIAMEDSNKFFPATRKITVTLKPEYHVVKDGTNDKETKVESTSAMVILFHELVHALDYVQECKVLKSRKTIVFPPDYDRVEEYIAIELGIDGISENSLRRDMSLSDRVNHRDSRFPPFSIVAKEENYKIELLEAYLQAYLNCGASWDSRECVRTLGPEHIARVSFVPLVRRGDTKSLQLILKAVEGPWSASMLQWALGMAAEKGDKKLFQLIFDAAGKGQWSADTLKEALREAAEKEDKEIFQLILKEGEGAWSANTLQWALNRAAGKGDRAFGRAAGKGDKELCQLILKEGKGTWSADTLQWALGRAAGKGDKELCQLILKEGEGTWSADALQRALFFAKNEEIIQLINVKKEELSAKITPVMPHSAKKKRILTIKYDCGYGHSIYIRGTGGAGLSWHKGIQLRNDGPDTWVYETDKDFDALEFKVLVDDSRWEDGSNHSIAREKTEEYEPKFQ